MVLNRSADFPRLQFWASVSDSEPGLTGLTTTGATANTSTGLGSPKGASIVSDLVATTLTTPLTTIAASAGTPQARREASQAPHPATSRAKTHASKLHERELARQEKRAADKHQGEPRTRSGRDPSSAH